MPGRGLRAAIIADDLTGAMDSAAPFARCGLEVMVLTRPDAIGTIASGDVPQVLSVNTNTRHECEEEAIAIVSSVSADLLELNPDLLIKKIDSTLRGNVVAETLATMKAAGRHDVMLCPAVPAQGRTVEAGEVFIGSVPLRDTAIGSDLRSPPPGAPLQELFQAADPSLTINSRFPGSSEQQCGSKRGRTLSIPDTRSRSDLLALARQARPHLKTMLFAGASGITEALAETLYGPANHAVRPKALPGLSLFVVGSLASQAAAQVETVVNERPAIRVLELYGNRDDNLNELQKLAETEGTFNGLVIRPPVKAEKTSGESDRIARELAACTAAFLEKATVSVLLVTGGDTAAAVLECLRLTTITISGEIQPGVVHGLVETPRGPVRLVTKAGGFGDNRLFCTILDYFH